MTLLSIFAAFVAFALLGYFIGRWDTGRKEYIAGFNDGASEERSWRNQIVMRAKLDACKKGRFLERVQKAAGCRN